VCTDRWLCLDQIPSMCLLPRTQIAMQLCSAMPAYVVDIWCYIWLITGLESLLTRPYTNATAACDGMHSLSQANCNCGGTGDPECPAHPVRTQLCSAMPAYVVDTRVVWLLTGLPRRLPCCPTTRRDDLGFSAPTRRGRKREHNNACGCGAGAGCDGGRLRGESVQELQIRDYHRMYRLRSTNSPRAQPPFRSNNKVELTGIFHTF
jgi:hypothetical protein